MVELLACLFPIVIVTNTADVLLGNAVDTTAPASIFADERSKSAGSTAEIGIVTEFDVRVEGRASSRLVVG